MPFLFRNILQFHIFNILLEMHKTMKVQTLTCKIGYC